MGSSQSTETNSSSSGGSGNVHALLNVYAPVEGDGGSSTVGLGVYHSGLEIYGTEYTFAGNESRNTGVVNHRPKADPPGWKYKQTVDLGPTEYSRSDIKDMVNHLKQEFPGNTYHITNRNCNHFTEAFCELLDVPFPTWVNRAAKMGNVVRNVIGKENFDNMATGSPSPTLADVESPAQGLENINLIECVDLSRLGCLNSTETYPVANLFSAQIKKKMNYLESDADEQLLLIVLFKRAVKLHTISLKINGKSSEQEYNPHIVKLFKNKPAMDFSDAEDAKVTEEFDVSKIFKKDLSTSPSFDVTEVQFPLKFVRWQDVNCVTIFVQSNGGAETTRIYGLTVFGQDPEMQRKK